MSVDKNCWDYYQTNDLAMVPYMAGTPVYTDAMLPFLYQKTKEEGKIELTFCGDLLNLDAFVTFFVKRGTMQVLCEIEGDKTLKPVGYSWVDNPRGKDGARGALVGFCFFKNSSKRESARNLGRLALAYMMVAMRIDVLHGVLLEENTQASDFCIRLGSREVAIVPKYHYSVSAGELVGARVLIIEKETYLPEFEKWFEGQPKSDPVHSVQAN
jgi:hypothetical protein